MSSRALRFLTGTLLLAVLPFNCGGLFALQEKQDPAVDAQAERQERLRGSVTPEREWWDLKHYHLSVEFMPDSKELKGSNQVTFEVLKPAQRMQIDVQPPLEITDVRHGDTDLKFERDGNVYWIDFPAALNAGDRESITISYAGKPREAKRPPWDGGVTWSEDEKGNPFIVTTCQGIGASVWWPTKDHGYDEPDDGMKISLTVPEQLSAVSNGRLESSESSDGKRTFHWIVTQPINNYCINANIGNYVNFSEQFAGEAGQLDLDYWVLKHQKDVAEKHFKEVPRTIKAFEHWFGPYPFYEDSFKIVSVPYPGMEHQSSVTYGNGFKNGYGGRDLSRTGVGFKFDFIIVHESGHEWFGNNISMKDTADMWIHEGFTNYSENLFVEYHFTEKEAQDYVIGCRGLVGNKKPIIGEYGMNREGSGDMYYKGGNMLHTMRHVLNDDDKWRAVLRGLNKDFWHQTVTTQQIESYINEKTGIDFTEMFDQYLRDNRIPVLNYEIDGENLTYWFSDVVDGFSYPTRIRINEQEKTVSPTTDKQTLKMDSAIETVELDRNFYFEFRVAD